jgi:hypothetical protein
MNKSLKDLLFKKTSIEKKPLFNSQKELAEKIYSIDNSYKSTKSLYAFLNQVLNGIRPCPAKLSKAILEVVKLQISSKEYVSFPLLEFNGMLSRLSNQREKKVLFNFGPMQQKANEVIVVTPYLSSELDLYDELIESMVNQFLYNNSTTSHYIYMPDTPDKIGYLWKSIRNRLVQIILETPLETLQMNYQFEAHCRIMQLYGKHPFENDLRHIFEQYNSAIDAVTLAKKDLDSAHKQHLLGVEMKKEREHKKKQYQTVNDDDNEKYDKFRFSDAMHHSLDDSKKKKRKGKFILHRRKPMEMNYEIERVDDELTKVEKEDVELNPLTLLAQNLEEEKDRLIQIELFLSSELSKTVLCEKSPSYMEKQNNLISENTDKFSKETVRSQEYIKVKPESRQSNTFRKNRFYNNPFYQILNISPIFRKKIVARSMNTSLAYFDFIEAKLAFEKLTNQNGNVSKELLKESNLKASIYPDMSSFRILSWDVACKIRAKILANRILLEWNGGSIGNKLRIIGIEAHLCAIPIIGFDLNIRQNNFDIYIFDKQKLLTETLETSKLTKATAKFWIDSMYFRILRPSNYESFSFLTSKFNFSSPSLRNTRKILLR